VDLSLPAVIVSDTIPYAAAPVRGRRADPIKVDRGSFLSVIFMTGDR
jgi:hypothetical protein